MYETGRFVPGSIHPGHCYLLLTAIEWVMLQPRPGPQPFSHGYGPTPAIQAMIQHVLTQLPAHWWSGFLPNPTTPSACLLLSEKHEVEFLCPRKQRPHLDKALAIFMHLYRTWCTGYMTLLRTLEYITVTSVNFLLRNSSSLLAYKL